MQVKSGRIFLTADWRFIALINYEIDPAVLQPFVPAKTEIAKWNGKTYVSMVGFLFLNTRVLGVPVPFHRNFTEANLRFYVHRETSDGLRRGVVFVREIVPRFAVASTARWLFNERYITLSMKHKIETQDGTLKDNSTLEYLWRTRKRWNSMRVRSTPVRKNYAPGSHEEFILQNNWGYTALPDQATSEYRVDHPAWSYWDGAEPALDCDIPELYGTEFVPFLTLKPASAFVADGSPVAVYNRKRI